MIYDTVIIGGGVVGLSILRTALLSGYNAILLEKNPHLLDGASGRNSGIIYALESITDRKLGKGFDSRLSIEYTRVLKR
jgi:glycine/D-amino acid oxidase-like deaminating enzyme